MDYLKYVIKFYYFKVSMCVTNKILSCRKNTDTYTNQNPNTDVDLELGEYDNPNDVLDMTNREGYRGIGDY